LINGYQLVDISMPARLTYRH